MSSSVHHIFLFVFSLKSLGDWRTRSWCLGVISRRVSRWWAVMLEDDGLREEGERVLVGMEEKLPHMRPEAEQWVSLPLSQHNPCSDTEYQHYTAKMQQWLNNWKKKLWKRWKHLKANNNQDKKLFLSRVLEEKAGISWNCREMVIGPRAIGGIWQGYGQVGGRGPGPCLNWNWK